MTDDVKKRKEIYPEIIDHEPWLLEFLPLNGDIAIDVGANAGKFSMGLAKVFKWVFAFEPNPETFKKLKSDWALWRPRHVSFWKYAVYSKNGEMEFNLYEQDVWGSLHERADYKKQGTITVKTMKLDNFIDYPPVRGKIDFIKMDIEGAEVEAVKGAMKLIRKDKPSMLIEVHSNENKVKLLKLLDEFNITIIRHPNYPQEHPFYDVHLWLFVEYPKPSEEKS